MVLSKTGQKIVEKDGYIPVPASVVAKEFEKTMQSLLCYLYYAIFAMQSLICCAMLNFQIANDVPHRAAPACRASFFRKPCAFSDRVAV